MRVNNLFLALVVAALMGAAVIFEKLSLREGSPIGIFAIRSVIITVILLGIALIGGHFREMMSYQPRTYLWILIPALLATVFIWLYFSVLQVDLASRVFPLVATAPVFTLFYSAVFLGEPMSFKRIGGVLLITIGILLVK